MAAKSTMMLSLVLLMALLLSCRGISGAARLLEEVALAPKEQGVPALCHAGAAEARSSCRRTPRCRSCPTRKFRRCQSMSSHRIRPRTTTQCQRLSHEPISDWMHRRFVAAAPVISTFCTSISLSFGDDVMYENTGLHVLYMCRLQGIYIYENSF